MVFRDYIEEVRAIFDKLVPDNDISEVVYEGPNIIVYTKNENLFANREDTAVKVAQEIRRRISIRPDPSIMKGEDESRKIVEENIPDAAGLKDIYFESDTGEVVIELEEPSIVSQKDSTYLKNIRTMTNWSPRVIRAPPMHSHTVKEVREFIRDVKEERKKFLNALGQKLNAPVMIGETWIRLTALGGHREVGRSATLISTNNSKILVDCGMMNTNTAGEKPWEGSPYLYLPEVQPLSSIDAVVLTHAHLDHSGMAPMLYKYGYEGPIYMTQPTRDLAILLQNDFIKVAHMEGYKAPYETKTHPRRAETNHNPEK